MNNKLKPCPFCGGKAQFEEVSETLDTIILRAWKIKCSKCWCSPYPNNYSGDKEELVKIWNARAGGRVKKNE